VSFAIPDGLAPEVYPLAWLVGSWRGEGVISYPGIDTVAVLQDAHLERVFAEATDAALARAKELAAGG